ncbi:hypothetical protein K435DRAFT_809567 [Dendrothele bispora CBS 962.96]|uniref:Uncharacterized protein n=1 Tax=Dendrothele bispora (strain CBS 962.96) TaxID=1314807 RepID=A0A4V4HBU9_DENBC|nr:hypothetical protein K435DRAFT_809567 [Dendrothele bispora CBS 962.96]
MTCDTETQQCILQIGSLELFLFGSPPAVVECIPHLAGVALTPSHHTGSSGGGSHDVPPALAATGVGAAGAVAYAHHQAGGQQGGSGGGGRVPSVVSSSQSSNGPGGMMTAGRLAKKKEAYGHHEPSTWQQQQQQQQGGAGGAQGRTVWSFWTWTAAVGGMGGPAQGQSGSGSGSGGRYSGDGYGERGMVVHNPDMDEEGGQRGYAGRWSEEDVIWLVDLLEDCSKSTRYLQSVDNLMCGIRVINASLYDNFQYLNRKLINFNTWSATRSIRGKLAPRDGPNPSGVLVHRDGGKVPEPQQPETPAGPEEIPPTYDSLVLDGDERPRNGKGGGGGGGGGEGGASVDRGGSARVAVIRRN